MKVLYSNIQIRDAIRRVLTKGSDRGLAVAFIGAGAESYLPADLHGTTIVCWLKPGCTDPTTLRRLRARGAALFEANGLHAKVYWSSSGAVVTSANLSGNGLGDGGFTEAGVLVPRGVFQPKHLLRNTQMSEVTSARLIQYERTHRAFIARNSGTTVFDDEVPSEGRRPMRRPVRRAPDFLEWFDSFGRTPWDWLCYSEIYTQLGSKSRERLSERGARSANDFVTGRPGDFRPKRWILAIDLKAGRNDMCWLYPDCVSKLSSADQGYTKGVDHEAVQVNPASSYYPPPFELNGSTKKAIRTAVKDFGVRSEKDYYDHCQKTAAPPARFLARVKAILRAGAA